MKYNCTRTTGTTGSISSSTVSALLLHVQEKNDKYFWPSLCIIYIEYSDCDGKTVRRDA